MTRSADGLSDRTLAVIMAGGQGSRLGELTRRQAKPALPFGGHYRNIDFSLSNCLNSGIRATGVLTQYMPHALIQHVHRGWSRAASENGHFAEIWPAQRTGPGRYSGTADAVFQNLDLIEKHSPELVLVLAGDHVYKMDFRPMLEAHVANGADVTIGCVEVPLDEASEYGVMAADAKGWAVRFDEKPSAPIPMPGDPASALASMGIYVFEPTLLAECLESKARCAGSRRDFGRDVLPELIRRGRALAYPFRRRDDGANGYWRDVGTIDGYWQAHMELLSEQPALDLHDESWPFRTDAPNKAPPHFVGAGVARSSIVSNGCRVAGQVERSVLSPGACVEAGARVVQSVVLPNAQIGRHCRIRRAIVDSGCVIPDGTVIGEDLLSAAESYGVSKGGVVLVTAETIAVVAGRDQREVA